jgi:uncharacterized protein YbgA (DUF1722 family)
MIYHDNAIQRLPLAVLMQPSAATGHRGTDGKNYQVASAPQPLGEYFELHSFVLEDLAAAAQVRADRPWLCGVVLTESMRPQPAEHVGWAAELNIGDPVPPVEFAEQLRLDQASESFVARAFTCRAWRELLRGGLTHGALQAFFARHKYLLMSRHIGSYRQIGQLLAEPLRGSDGAALEALARQTIELIMAGLRRPATRGGHGNALAHIRGYLKHRLSAAEQVAFDEAVEWYRLGLVPLNTPLALLREYFERYPDAYIQQQVYMQPWLHATFDPLPIIERDRHGPKSSNGER